MDVHSFTKDLRPEVLKLANKWCLRDPACKKTKNLEDEDLIHYATHSAILRRNGGRFLSKKNNGTVEYDWMGDM